MNIKVYVLEHGKNKIVWYLRCWNLTYKLFYSLSLYTHSREIIELVPAAAARASYKNRFHLPSNISVDKA